MLFLQAPSINGCLVSTSQLPQWSGRKCVQTHAELGRPSPDLLQGSSDTISEQLLGNHKPTTGLVPAPPPALLLLMCLGPFEEVA